MDSYLVVGRLPEREFLLFYECKRDILSRQVLD